LRSNTRGIERYKYYSPFYVHCLFNSFINNDSFYALVGEERVLPISTQVMPDATTNTTTAGANTTEQELSCTTCLANFESKEAKRAHMKEEWQ
jgi:hypothetical protein